MFCQNCGKEMPDDSLFCPECGAKQEVKEVVKSTNEKSVKKCEKCGYQIPEDGEFCPECGTRLSQANATPKEESINQDMNSQESYATNYTTKQKVQLSPEEIEKTKKRNKMIGIVAASFAAVCLLIVLLVTFIKPSINLNKYITISVNGYDTVGKAVIEFDSDKFEQDYEKKLSKKSSKLNNLHNVDTYFEDLFDSFDDSTASSVFIQQVVSGDLDKNNSLCNGDIITFKWDCNDEYALETYGMKLKYSDIEYTVEGLEEAEIFDPFEGIEVSFTGIAPNGHVEITGSPKADAASDFRFESNKYDNLVVGDKITLSAYISYSDDPIQYCVDNYGMVPSTLSKEYTVSGLDSYIRTISDVSDKCIEEMKSQAEDVFNAKVTSSWKEDETLKGFEYIGNYLLTTKSNEGWGNDNILYLVYKVTVNDQFSNSKKEYNKNNDFYWYISFNNLLVNDLGETTVNITEYRTPNERFAIDSGIGNGWWGTKEWYYYGYETIDALYKAAVTCNIDSYNHEDNVDNSLTPLTDVEEEVVGDDGIIFPNSSTELIDESKAEELSDEDLRLAINEIYARNGYIFNDEELLEHFRQFDWYEEKVISDKFSMDMFNEMEIKNVEMLQKERDGR